jgi:hypothetical protein
MALRYASKQIQITGTIGTLFAHGLPATPDEYVLVQHGASVPQLVLASAPDATNIYVSSGPGGATVSVFAAVNHSVVKA